MPKTRKEALHHHLDYERRNLDKKTHMVEAFPLNLIAEAFPQGRWEIYYDGPEFLLPYDFSLVPELKAFMALQFPDKEMFREYQIIWDQHESAAYFVKYHWDKQCDLEFRFDSTVQGTTCQIQKIGEQTVVKPIYEVTCQDAESWST